jgi:hypothetical protein
LRKNATYYSSAEEVSDLLNHIEENEVVHRQRFVNENLEVIRKEYSWDHLVDQHEAYFRWLLEQK